MRAKKHEEHENHERWLVSYADFITLLFAFFVVMYATSTRNEEKEKNFEKTIRAEFKLAGNYGQQVGSHGGVVGPVIDSLEPMQRRGVRNDEIKNALEKVLQEAMKDEERKLAIQDIRADQNGVRISLSAEAYFASGSTKLKRPALQSLDKVAKIIKAMPYRIVVEGHTDDLPLPGNTKESNWELASMRATSVVKYLIQVHQLDGSRLSATSFADQKPLVPNTNAENRMKNRRIEIVIINEEP
ncbi:MAG: chemotaxis protein MotB [Oligoflexia bacterium]|nr:MAG: chemotaxis protein MotB [Oligoflexia bacterium]